MERVNKIRVNFRHFSLHNFFAIHLMQLLCYFSLSIFSLLQISFQRGSPFNSSLHHHHTTSSSKWASATTTLQYCTHHFTCKIHHTYRHSMSMEKSILLEYACVFVSVCSMHSQRAPKKHPVQRNRMGKMQRIANNDHTINIIIELVKWA